MQITTKFTPGPWSISTENMHCRQIDAEHHAICTDQFCYALEVEKDANAHLIAAAPELYEVAEATEDLFRELTGKVNQAFLDRFAKVHFAARAALAKARGEVVS